MSTPLPPSGPVSPDAVELALRHASAFAEAMPQIVWAARPDGVLDYTNGRWKAYSGSGDPAEWLSFVHPDDQERTTARWIESVGSGGFYETEFRLRRVDQTYRWHLVRAEAFRDGEGRIVRWLGTCTDIEDHKRTIDTLQVERELREKFVATLTHDLRNPLAAARMNAQMVGRKLGAGPEAILNLTKRIVHSLDRAENMIQDLLDAHRIRAGEPLVLEMKECNLREVVESTLADLSMIHGDRFDFDSDYEVVGYWNCDSLRRTIENLVLNAVKYGSAHDKISVTLKQRGAEASLSVLNRGNPISLEEQSVIFHPYKRTQSAKARGLKGWGLGLTLVRGVVEAHGGTVSVASSAAQGTVFSVSLPRDSRAFGVVS